MTAEQKKKVVDTLERCYQTFHHIESIISTLKKAEDEDELMELVSSVNVDLLSKPMKKIGDLIAELKE
jgi:flagellar biosynthesis/type III secretory pathway chaperone